MNYETDLQQRILNFYKSSSQTKSKSFLAFKSKKISTLDIIHFGHELSTLISTGIPISTALGMLADDDKPNLQQLILNIKSHIENGNRLGETLKKYPQYFNPLFIQLIHIGEQSGTLSAQLHQAACYLEKFFNLKNKFRKTLTYPIFVLSITGLITFGILTFIIPQFQNLFQSLGAQLPWLTRFIINLSHHLKYEMSLALSLISIGIFALYKIKKKSAQFNLFIDQFFLKLPLIGRMLSYSLTARTCHLLSITYSAGMPFPKGLHLLAQSIKNQVYSNSFLRIQAAIEAGQSLCTAISSTRLFPKRMIQMIRIGEESGTLETMLSKNASYYENKLDSFFEQMNKMLEPIMIVFLGMSIGIIIIAMYLPIFRLGSLF